MTDLKLNILEMILPISMQGRDIEKAGEGAFSVFYFILIFKLQGFLN
jgi:hypothetical protein